MVLKYWLEQKLFHLSGIVYVCQMSIAVLNITSNFMYNLIAQQKIIFLFSYQCYNKR